MAYKCDNGIVYELDQNMHTAKITSSSKTSSVVIVPKFIEHESNQFLITTIDSFAFRRNMSIESLKFAPDSSLQRICENAFIDSSIQNLSIPESLTELDANWCYGASYLTKIDVDPRNKNFVFIDEKFLIKIDKNRNFEDLIFTRRDVKGEIIIPSSVKRLCSSSFFNCHQLESISSFSENSMLEVIENLTFNGCENLKNIAPFPSSLKRVGDECFEYLLKLRSLEFLSEEIEFGNLCFWECSSLCCIEFPNAKFVEINVNSLNGVIDDFVLFVKCGAFVFKY